MNKLIINILSRLFFVGVMLACVLDVFAQSHVYKHYGVEDGLPSSEVYSAFQDSKGYMWFATDAGVSRFNGYEFENFDTSDGLTDNTVFLITEDSKGRVWFGTFNCQLSYYDYADEIIYSYKFNNILSGVLIQKGSMVSFQVDLNETIWMGFLRDGLYSIDKGGKVILNNSINNESLDLKIILEDDKIIWGSLKNVKLKEKILRKKTFEFDFFWNISGINGVVDKGNFLRHWSYVYGKVDNMYVIKHNGQILMILDDQIIRLGKGIEENNTKIKIPFLENNTLHSVYSADNYLWICLMNKGVYKCKLESADLVVVEHLLPKKSVSRVFKDKGNGFWFSTLKKGVIYLSNDKIECHENDSIADVEVDTLKGEIYKKYSNGRVTRGVIDGIKIDENLINPGIIKLNTVVKYNYNSNSLIVGDKYYLNGILNRYKKQLEMVDAKSYLIDSNMIYTVNGFGISITKNNEEIFNSFKEGYPKMWSTSLAKVKDEIWIGTKDGIRKYVDEKIIDAFSKNKYLSTSITSLATLNNDVILIGTKSFGLLVVKNDSIIDIIDKGKGLVSNLIRTIHIDNQNLVWLGTNEGICKLSYTGIDDYELFNITKKHGLISAEIKDIASYHNMVYAVTSKGLIQFDKTTIYPNLVPPATYISSFNVNEELKDLSVDNEFSYQENNVKIVYEGLNYRSLGDVEYQYRMLGVDTNWITTTTKEVRYPVLPFGEYNFQVKAKNEDGVWNENPTSINFIINPPFWFTWWFITIIILIIIIAVGGLFFLREKKIIEKNEIAKNKAATEKKMVELELRALRSQMNPHFIFNILNSIQHYIIANDFKSTNRYITQFAKLIRTVLHLSEKTVITIQEEIDMLTLYMSLEKMRFDEQFSFEIDVSEDIDVDYDEIPSMLIQPYVENSIWHGLMNKTKKGNIKIKLYLSESQLCCSIQDNGIGRERAQEIKSRRKIKQKSVGMSITKERLDIFGENDVNVITTDLKDEQGNPTGTKTEIRIPYKNEY